MFTSLRFAALAWAISTLALQAQIPELPRQFTITEQVFSLVTTFDMGGTGKVSKRFLSLADQYDWTSPSGIAIATGRKRLLSWGNVIDVTDPKGAKVGTIKEEVMKSLFKTFTTYTILDPQDRPLAKSEKVEWLGTAITLWGRNGNVIAKISRPWVSPIRDKWTVESLEARSVDPRLLVMIGVFKTDADNQRRKKD